MGRISRKLRRGHYAARIGAGAPVYLAAVLQYIAAEILQLAGTQAHAQAPKTESRNANDIKAMEDGLPMFSRDLASIVAEYALEYIITPRHIQLAVRNDEELNKLIGGITIASGGVLPNIHAILLPKAKAASPAPPSSSSAAASASSGFSLSSMLSMFGFQSGPTSSSVSSQDQEQDDDYVESPVVVSPPSAAAPFSTSQSSQSSASSARAQQAVPDASKFHLD